MKIAPTEIKYLYLVIDPNTPQTTLLSKIEQALEGGINLLQIWNNWPASFTITEKLKLIESIESRASAYQVPLLINEDWELLTHTSLSGVHFDHIPADYKQIQDKIGRKFMAGITCSNNLQVIIWAEENHLDYISFCSLFPSTSVTTCEIVSPQTIKEARAITRIPFFLSGGIYIDNMYLLKEFDFTGIALISGIMGANDPKEAASAYKQALTNFTL